MAHDVALRPDLQHLVDKYTEICDKFLTLRTLNEKQQRSLVLQRERLAKTKGRMRSAICWLIKREEWHRTSLDRLEKENEKLQYVLADMQRERDQVALRNSTKVSKLQDKVNLLRTQIVQLENKHEEELMSQDRRHKDEISKYESFLENANSFSVRNVAKKEKLSDVKKHPAFITGENVEKRKNRLRLPGLEVVKVTRKRRKLYREDEAAIDIV